MASFLRCLRAAFDPEEQMHHLTSVSLSPSPGDEDDLVLTVTCELPKELSSAPLTWRMYLRRQPAEATAREFVIPLVESQRVQRERTEGLVEIIRQKDALISKMLDKLEVTGTGLEHVFAVVGTRKKVSREQAESRVKGLAPFDRAAWEASPSGDGASRDMDALVRGVFGAGVEYTPSAEAGHYAEGLGSWWKDVGSVLSGPKVADDRESTIGRRTAPLSSGGSQVKSSPQRSPAKLKEPPDDATASGTASEDEAPKKPARRIGAIGGARPSPKAPPPPDDEETASESGESKGPSSGDERAFPRESTPLPVRERSPTGSATASEDEAPSRPSPAKRGRGGLGKIGGVMRPRREVSEEGEGSEEEKGPAKEEVKPERKVLARPVKKKRKF
ncbi:hypothetical protein VUR80DRAFT_10380 [Thermomyces stellatus]